MATCNLISGQIKKIVINLKLDFRIIGKSWNQREPVLAPHPRVLPAQHLSPSGDTPPQAGPEPGHAGLPRTLHPSLLKLHFLKTMRDCG